MSTPGRGLHGHVLETLGPAITAGEYPPGSVLRTDELAQRFDVSRSVMREAVRVLADRVLEATGHALSDDATVLCLDWHGGHGRDRDSVHGAEQGRASDFLA